MRQGSVKMNGFRHYVCYFKRKNSNYFFTATILPFGVVLFPCRRFKKKSLFKIGTHLVTHLHNPSFSDHSYVPLSPNTFHSNRVTRPTVGNKNMYSLSKLQTLTLNNGLGNGIVGGAEKESKQCNEIVCAWPKKKKKKRNSMGDGG
ncbi:hypothetical protein V8G54_031309 [Vigna mungo]|uniref:Uncharacterized protein n=1 Tax=Vigna mungo TaxID=3915 RepID=A0AAQ3MXY6_VIGMU